jgi:hypothetical protein
MLPIFLHEDLERCKFDKWAKRDIIAIRLKIKEEALWQKQW